MLLSLEYSVYIFWQAQRISKLIRIEPIAVIQVIIAIVSILSPFRVIKKDRGCLAANPWRGAPVLDRVVQRGIEPLRKWYHAI